MKHLIVLLIGRIHWIWLVDFFAVVTTSWYVVVVAVVIKNLYLFLSLCLLVYLQDKLFSSKNKTEAVLGKKLKIRILPEIEKIHKVSNSSYLHMFNSFVVYDTWADSFQSMGKDLLVSDYSNRRKRDCWKSNTDKPFFLVAFWLLKDIHQVVHSVTENLLHIHLVNASIMKFIWSLFP